MQVMNQRKTWPKVELTESREASFVTQNGQSSFLFTVLFSFFFLCQSAQATLPTLLGGVNSPNPMGSAFMTLDHSIGFQLDVLADSPVLGPVFKLHFTADYEPYSIKYQTSMNVNMGSLMAGMMYQSGDYGRAVTLFWALDAGAVYEVLNFSGVSSVASNNQISFATQLVPGVDIPVWRTLGLVFEMPVKFVFLLAPNNPLVILNPAILVRWKL